MARLIGDQVSERGIPIEVFEIGVYATIGAPNPDFVYQLIQDMKENGIVKCDMYEETMLGVGGISLTMKGWEMWQELSSGSMEFIKGMIAMKFGDKTLDQLVEEVMKPAIKNNIHGYSLIRVDDNPRAGIIDMIMRQTIQESAFVLADLTHGNNGAYWEAGYAEGLGKPVIYLCEKGKFKRDKTHFDTNHCTTIVWDRDKPEEFSKQLVAAIKNSLNIIN